MLSVLFIPMLISICGFPNQVLAQIDKTLEAYAVGEEVVDAVVDRIGSNLFGPDHMFLKRLAYVESEFGNKLSPQNFNGGIWRVSKEEYHITKRLGSSNTGFYNVIYKEFKIKWAMKTKYTDLRKPLYSALAVHMLLCRPSNDIESTLCKCNNTFPQLLEDQANYLHQNFNQTRPTIPSKENFTSAIKAWESNLTCKAKMDLVVVLDGSGSIKRENFKRAKEFVAKLFSAYYAETTRLGLVVYGSEVDFKLDFSPRKSAKELNDTVLGIEYPDSETYTNKGISAALSIFEKGERRSGTAKIMAVFTDGKSDDGVLAVNEVIQQKITTYAVGVGLLPSQSELLQIAGGDSSHVVNVDNYTALYESVTAIVSDICRQPVRPEGNQRVEDALAENERRHYKMTTERGSRSKKVFFKHEGKARTSAYFGYSPGVSPVYNKGQLRVGINEIPLPRRKFGAKRRSSATRRYDEDLDRVEYYLTEGEEADDDDDNSKPEESEEEENSVYIVVVGLEPVQSKYIIMAINDTKYISDLNVTDVYVHTTTTTTTATTMIPTKPIAPSPTTSKPKSGIHSETGRDWRAFFPPSTHLTSTTARTSTGLHVHLPPFIVKQPSTSNLLLENLETKCESNQSIVLECEAEGNPPPNYSWIKDGKEVNFQADNDRIFREHGRGTLVIKLPRSSDFGQYQCLAKNELGTSISNTVFLRKAGASTMELSKNLTMVAEEGKPFQLPCITHRGPRTSVHWIQENSQGAQRNVSSERITADPDGHLWFSVVTTDDKSEDYYYACAEFCPLRNEYKIWSRINLTVTPSPTPVNQHPPVIQYTTDGSIVALKGHGVDLWCIFSGMPLPKVTWARKDREISSKRFQYKNYNKTLRIQDVDFSDEGTYECVATNGVDPSTSHSINLSVFAVPYFTVEPEIQHLNEGQTAVFRCEASGKPSPEIRWVHNGAPLDQARSNPRRKLVDGNQVVIENLTKGDTGNYGCNASNSFSYVYKDVYVNVLTFPANHSAENEHGQGFGEKDMPIWIWITSALAVVLVSGLCILVLLLWRKYNLAVKMIRNLTREEVDEFHWGKPGEANNEHEAPLGNAPYNEDKKIRSEDLQIESTILGEGQFGIVHKGIFQGQCVAVKSSKSSADVEYFKAFLKEIKVMAYIGDHENIVRFYGAVVDKIEERICQAVMELSTLGDLNSYLRTQSRALSDVKVEPLSKTSPIPKYPQETLLNEETLLSFCRQIAAGMDYLARKTVIHGDLAARNVLVFADNVVKITDFGLSRKLYNCANYTKENACPLPWRWMAIESLRFFEFSIKSDVWSFGVTMWEILSLAEVPFPGLDWTTDFVAQLESGFRLAKPKRCTPTVFEWMKRCWENNAEDRPTFAECVTFLSATIHNSQINKNVVKFLSR